MAKKKHAKKSGMGFAIFMVVYAVLALCGIGFGLKWFWGFIDAYEASRPHIPIDAYMEEMTPDRVVDSCLALVDQVDTNLQSEEECRQILLEALKEPISYARKASECTDTQQTYVLRSGDMVFGSFTIVSGAEDEYGFIPWHFGEEKFDLSQLMGSEKFTVTVPDGCGITVSVNGVELDERYIVDSVSTEYELLEDLYDKFDLPMFTLNTYEAGPFLGDDVTVQVLDADGKPFVYDDSFDPYSLIELTDKETVKELDSFLEDFLDTYVIFAGCANDARFDNYHRIMKYVVPDSNFAQRMLDALEGLQFAQSRGDEVDTITVHNYVQLDENTYMCVVTYLVNTTGREGVVQTTNNVKILMVRTNGKLLVESMVGY